MYQEMSRGIGRTINRKTRKKQIWVMSN